MENIKDEVLDFIAEEKQQKVFEYELYIEEVKQLEKCKDEFVREVKRIIGNFKMEIKDNDDNLKLLRITKIDK